MSLKSQMVGVANRTLARFDTFVGRRSDLWRPLDALGRQPEGGYRASSMGEGFLRVFRGSATPGEETSFDCAVVVPTILKTSLCQAVESVFHQDFDGTIQILIGVDQAYGALDPLLSFLENVPANISVTLFYPGYSTSRRHGGLHPAFDGGALRTILSYMANSARVAYLDDDNWWAPDHLQTLATALDGRDWAYSRRMFVHPATRNPICEDVWESVGPGAGAFRDRGGWVDPNCLMIDKLRCEAVLRWWAIPLRNSLKAMDADRNVFAILSTEFFGRDTNRPTVFYTVTDTDERHPFRLEAMGRERYDAAGSLGAAPAGA